MLDANCLLDTVPEAARYMEYRFDVIHVSVMFSAIVMTMDPSASPHRRHHGGAGHGNNSKFQGTWYCASAAGRSMIPLSRAAASLAHWSRLSSQRFPKCCLNVISLHLSTVVHCVTCTQLCGFLLSVGLHSFPHNRQSRLKTKSLH